MKKFYILILSMFLFSACKYEPPCYSVAVSIDTDSENTILVKTQNSSYIRTKLNTVITGKYFWLPFEPNNPSIQNVISTNNNVITITSIDYENKIFTAIAKSTGEATINVIIDDKNISSTLIIYVY